MINKAHFVFSKEAYVNGVVNNSIGTQWAGLDYREEAPTFETFDYNMRRVGTNWDWDLMQGRFSEEAILPTLTDEKTRLRIFTADKRDVGYVLIVPAGRSLSDKFGDAVGENPIEILTIGLYPEECGNKQGWKFFEMQFKDLFKRHDAVYWSSSSTNHPNLAAFYERMGATVLLRESVPDPRIHEQRNFG